MFNCFQYKKIFLVLASLFTVSFPLVAPAQNGENASSTNEILSISSNQNGNTATVNIRGLRPFVSTTYELPNPKRVVIDLANVSVSEKARAKIALPFKYNIDSVKGTDPTIVRIELFPNDLESFTSNNNNEELTITLNTSSSSQNGSATPPNTDVTASQKLVKYNHSDNKDTVFINTGKKRVKYTTNSVTIDSKYSLQIDIDDISLADSSVGIIKTEGTIDKITVAKRGSGARITLFSKNEKPFSNTIKEQESGIEILVSSETLPNSKAKTEGKNQNIANQLPDINPLESQISPQAREQQMQDAFNFSGYNKDRITVEFQKMDLHNVFNFLRQVSGVNIVVDESVQGSLTLVLDDVPWDFALDIILNLKNLEKEERFNTIVIYPKGKGFLWPQQAENNLSFEADTSVIAKEALVVQQQEKQSPDRVEAKQILAKAQTAEQSEDYEKAVSLYEQALEKWNDNPQIANKISSLYLGPLHQNAKSLYYSNKALAVEPKNQFALLQAGIASANMQNYTEAEKFFSQSVSGAKPSKEALLNYAAFKEERSKFSESLSLLSEHDRHHGKSMDSMLASARVNDKAGNAGQAVRCYRELLNSGYRLPPDLQKYVQERVSH